MGATVLLLDDDGAAAPPVSARTGPVRLEHRSFADDGGAWNPLGASLFWALWGERNDPDRLDANLSYLAAHGFDFIRMLGMVGAPSWEDRTIDPYAPDYWDFVGMLFRRLERHGIRAHVTVFADAQVMMPNVAERRTFAATWAQFANANRDLLLSFEVCNEHWQNGIAGISELRDLGAILASHTGVAVSLSSAFIEEGGVPFQDMYAGSAADFATVHYDRDTGKADGIWRPVRQPWGWSNGEYGEHLPPTAMNNEPIGPDSSVAEDADPLRLAMAYATTFVAHNAGYVYHCGAGIRGGGYADAAKGRLANVYDYPQEIASALKAMRALLPAGLANWANHNSQWESFPWKGFNVAVEDGRLMRAYAATNGGAVVLVLLDQTGAITVTARQGYRLTRHDPLTGAALYAEDVPAGASWTVPATQAGSVFIGAAL